MKKLNVEKATNPEDAKMVAQKIQELVKRPEGRWLTLLRRLGNAR